MVSKVISSLQHPIVKHLVRLRLSSSYRQEQKSLLLSGKKLILETGRSLVFKRLLLPCGAPSLTQIRSEEVLFLPPPLFKKVTGLIHPEPIAAEVSLPEESSLIGLKHLLALDGVSDPGNLGTLLRTALALGWEGVFLTKGCADLFNDKALRAAKGASLSLPYRRGSEEELKKLIEKEALTALAADTKGSPLPSLSFTLPIVLILGSEASGISPALKELSRLVAIPMTGKMESLNVAAAGSILMYELIRLAL